MATYAIVKTGGKQYKVAVGDVVKVEKLESEQGEKVSLPVALVVDGATVTTDAKALAKVAVTGEVLGHTKGPRSVSTSSRTRLATTNGRDTVSS
ncbi:50S ribosomal protein L21 [Mycobacterium tuberculosis]|nr:50S ribosomal protein L21 [Mycobacterium tuberculosis]